MTKAQLKVEWQKLGRRAKKLWALSAGLDPEIDVLFKRMDAIDKAISKPRTRLIVRRRAARA